MATFVRKWGISGVAGTFSDRTNAMRNPGDAAVKLFPDAEKIGDCLYIGSREIFTYINMHLFTPGVILANNTVWEYWNGSKWTALSVVDGTNAGSGPLTQSGTVSWEAQPPTDWVACTINGQLRNWVRLRITASGTTYSTTPTGDYCSLPPGFGYVYLYCHDGSGELSTDLQEAVESAVELYRGCGIIVDVKFPLKIQPPITVQISVAENYDATYMAEQVKQKIVDFLNSRVLGDDLYIAELYQLVMSVNDKAVVNSLITAPQSDIIVPDSGVLRADPDVVVVTAVSM